MTVKEYYVLEATLRHMCQTKQSLVSNQNNNQWPEINLMTVTPTEFFSDIFKWVYVVIVESLIILLKYFLFFLLGNDIEKLVATGTIWTPSISNKNLRSIQSSWTTMPATTSAPLLTFKKIPSLNTKPVTSMNHIVNRSPQKEGKLNCLKIQK